jgi:hypothetical protein
MLMPPTPPLWEADLPCRTGGEIGAGLAPEGGYVLLAFAPLLAGKGGALSLSGEEAGDVPKGEDSADMLPPPALRRAWRWGGSVDMS